MADATRALIPRVSFAESVEPFEESKRRMIRHTEMPFGPVVGSEELFVGVNEDPTSAIARPGTILGRAYEGVLFKREVVER